MLQAFGGWGFFGLIIFFFFFLAHMFSFPELKFLLHQPALEDTQEQQIPEILVPGNLLYLLGLSLNPAAQWEAQK